MLSLIKLLKIVLPVATVTTATIVTTSLISFSKKETEKDSESKDKVLNDFELTANEFKEKKMLYSKDGKGKSVTLDNEDLSDEFIEKLRQNPDLIEGPEFEGKLPSAEQLKEILSKVSNSPSQPKSGKQDLQKEDKDINSDSGELEKKSNIPSTQIQKNELNGPQTEGQDEADDDKVLQTQATPSNEPQSDVPALETNHSGDLDSQDNTLQQSEDGNDKPIENENSGSDGETMEEKLDVQGSDDDQNKKVNEIKEESKPKAIDTPDSPPSNGEEDDRSVDQKSDKDDVSASNQTQESSSDLEASLESENNLNESPSENKKLDSKANVADPEPVMGQDSSDALRDNKDSEINSGSKDGKPKLSPEELRVLQELEQKISPIINQLQALSS